MPSISILLKTHTHGETINFQSLDIWGGWKVGIEGIKPVMFLGAWRYF